jgi:hypothetical protein
LSSTRFYPRLREVNLLLKCAKRILRLLPLQLICFSGGLACADPQLGKEPAAKSKFKDIQLGPFRLDLGANLRLRHEYQAGFDVRKYAPGTHDHFLLTRIMVDFNLRLDSDRRVFVQLRDAHPLGTRLDREDFSKSNPMEDLCDIRQAYFEWKKVGGSHVDLKLGRQQISYGDQRIFGPGLWGNTGRWAWDAALAHVDTSRAWIDTWVGRPIENRPEVWPNREFDAPTALVVYSGIKNLPFRLDVFYAGKYDGKVRTNGESGTDTLRSHSIGFQLQKQAREWVDFTASLVGQTGNYGKDTIRAFGANMAAGLTLPLRWRPRIAGQFTWGSGDHNPSDGTHGTFDGVFGGADINFYGDMNLFFWANLRDYEWDFHLQPARAAKIAFEHHYFTLDSARDAWYTTGLAALRRDMTGNSGTALGHEVNLRLSWQPQRWPEIMVGLGHFFPGEFVRKTGAAKSATGYFLQVAYGF